MINEHIDFIQWRDLNSSELISNFINTFKGEYEEFTKEQYEAYKQCKDYKE